MRVLVFIFISMQMTWMFTLSHKCYKWDSQCTTALAKALAPYIIHRMYELSKPQIEPISYDLVQIHDVGVELDFKDVKINGLSNITIDHFSFDTYANNMSRIIFCTELFVTGRYKGNATVFSMPAYGAGNIRYILRNLRFEVTTEYDTMKDVNGVDHAILKDYQFRYDVKDVASFQVENAYYGNKDLGDKFHYLLNKNWKLVTEIYFGRFMGQIINSLVEAVRNYLSTIPLSSLVAL